MNIDIQSLEESTDRGAGLDERTVAIMRQVLRIDKLDEPQRTIEAAKLDSSLTIEESLGLFNVGRDDNENLFTGAALIYLYQMMGVRTDISKSQLSREEKEVLSRLQGRMKRMDELLREIYGAVKSDR